MSQSIKSGFILIEAIILFMIVLLIVTLVTTLPSTKREGDMFDNELFQERT